jgi:hypothetical protein
MALDVVERAVVALLEITKMGLTAEDFQEMMPEVPLQQIKHACNDMFQRWRVQRLVVRNKEGTEHFVYFSVHLKTSCPTTPKQFEDRDDLELLTRANKFMRI